ncbi:MAG: hypothetical protein ILNGONEN_00780 [Syntrophorhabdaceae bacterium]|nr:hypothetical protein [Syntrophorhabdaceae bacterium]
MADKIRQIKYNCSLLNSMTMLKLRDIYFAAQQGLSPTYKKTQFEDYASKDICGIKKPDGTYDEDLCPACITLKSGGNL